MASSRSNPEAGRKPYRYSLVDEIGVGYAIGAVAGTAFEFVKGMYDSPNGQRFIGGTRAVRMNFTRWGGTIAAWEGVVCTFEHTMIYLRQKDDPWNRIVAFGGSAGLLTLRQGLGPAYRMALCYGVGQAILQGGDALMLNKQARRYKELELKLRKEFDLELRKAGEREKV